MQCLLLMCFSHMIVGWQTAAYLYTELALDALNMAVCARTRAGNDLSGLVHHSDRSVQYRSVVYTDCLDECAVVASGGVGIPMIMLWPKRSTPCIRQNSFTTPTPGRGSQTWRQQLRSMRLGLTHLGCTPTWAIAARLKWRRSGGASMNQR